ncbi:MAG: sigma-70 family RNA polymerase sigma factor [Enhygromyxa sp.]
MLSTMDLEALLRAARDGQPGAWKALYPRLHGTLLGYFRRRFDESSAVELTDRTIEILTRELPNFVPRESLTQWVFGVARNRGRLEGRARAKSRALSDLAALIVNTANTSPTQRIHAQELSALLLEEIEQLPAHYRRVIEHDLDNDLNNEGSIKDEEFAAREGIEVATVWSRRHRAINMLRDRLMARLNPPRPLPRVADSTSTSSSPPA